LYSTLATVNTPRQRGEKRSRGGALADIVVGGKHGLELLLHFVEPLL
jgi:hypothetical protein